MNKGPAGRNVFFIVTAILALFLALQIPGTAQAEDPAFLDDLNRLSGSSFTDDQYLTREEFCTAISKVFVKTTSEAGLPFTDADLIQPENQGYISALYQKGILSGSAEEDGLYMYPNSPITRQEAITLLAQVLSKSSNSLLNFSDADMVAPYAYPYLAWFADNRIIVGYPDGTLGPQNNMTAFELAVLTVKTVEYNEIYRQQEWDASLLPSIGTGMRGSLGGEASASRFTMPHRVLFDPQGNLVVVDTYNNMIRTVIDNEVDVYIGQKIQLDEYNYQKGYYLDTELEEALLNRPADAVFSTQNEIFIADSGNDVIRFVREDRVYTFSGTIKGYADGDRKTAKFNQPMAIAIDRNNILYVADTLNNCIRKIDTKGNVTTIAGTPGKAGFADGDAGKALFLDPAGIAVSDNGNTIYVADTGNHKIRKIENGTVTTIAGASGEADADEYPEGGFNNGSAAQAMFNQPTGITVVDGIILVADSGNHMIRAINQQGNVVTVCGNGEPGDEEEDLSGAALNRPMGVYVHEGYLYIADTLNNKIKIIPFDAGNYK